MANRTFNNVKITSEFAEAEVRENIVSGETLGTIFGKIQKNIGDLSNTAFDGNATTIDTITSDTGDNTGNVYPVFVDSNNSTSTEETLKTSELLQFWASKGGVSQLTIGGKNSSSGLLKLCSNEYYSVLRAASSPTADVYCYFPDKSGTLALKTDIPDKLPADGGNATTVNGHTVNSDVPANAKFTDTTYSLATSAANGLMSANDKLKLNYTNIAYATCDTAADTSAKVATISGNSKWSLAVGSIVTVKFSVTNTASNCTLNVNGTGAKQIWYHNSVYTGNSASVTGAVDTFVRFMYDGTYWVWIGHSADNSPGYASATAAGIVSTGTQHFKGAKYFEDSVFIPNPNIVMGDGAPSADTSRGFVFTSSDNSMANASAWVQNVARTSGNNELYLYVKSLSSKVSHIGLAIKVNADRTNYYTYVTNPAQSTQVAVRNISSGTTEATTTNCPSGAWYGKHS